MSIIVFCDMDGVLADFDADVTSGVNNDPPEMFVPGFFRKLKVMPGAKEGVAELLKNPRIQLYIGSKPTYKNPLCATEKYEWIIEHFPELKKRMVLVCDKKLLRGNFLIDDDVERWGHKFKGGFIHFDKTKPEREWKRIVNFFRDL